jgi:bacteriophage N4 adsorption protein B
MEYLHQFLLSVYYVCHSFFYILFYIVAIFLLGTGFEDFAIDLYYWILTLFNRKWIERLRGLPLSKLHETPEKPIAVFIPAWQESAVIGHMLRRACSSIRYTSYDIFVGVYPNDPDTITTIKEISQEFPRIHIVIGSVPGPTTKADNLNQIHQGMRRYENQTGIRYDIIIMHDSEDIIHPMSMKIINYFVPDYDMVQLPVFPLEVPHNEMIEWSYADEFAENHLKDLVVRQHFAGYIPSAGVGTGYNRWLIEFIGTSFAKNMFARASMTEDYDISLRLAMGKAKILFLHQPFGLQAATRAYFPETLAAAVRQKSRWLIGICLQSWKNYGWLGDWKFRFSLYRDRKAVVSNLMTMLGYFVVLLYLFLELLRWLLSSEHPLASVVTQQSLLWYIVIATSVMMISRAIHRFYFVNTIYGITAGLLSIVRLPLLNFVNFLAATRALVQYFRSDQKKQPLQWDKTDHKFPTASGPVRTKGSSRTAPIIPQEQRKG